MLGVYTITFNLVAKRNFYCKNLKKFLKIYRHIVREELRLSVFENRVLSKTFEPKEEGITGEWRKLHNEEFNAMYYSPNINGMIK